MTLTTILRFSRATAPEEMFTGQWQSRATGLDDYKPYLDQRWQEGCTKAWKPWEEVKEQGYPRGYASVREYVSRTLRGKPQPVGPRPPRPAPSRAGSSPTPTLYLKATGSSSQPPLVNRPELTALAEHVSSFGHISPTCTATGSSNGSKRPAPPTARPLSRKELRSKILGG